MVMPHVDGSFVALVKITTSVISTSSNPNQTVTDTLKVSGDLAGPPEVIVVQTDRCTGWNS